jgi:hypothetical protein
VNVVFTTRELLEMEKEERGWYAGPIVKVGMEIESGSKAIYG